MTSTMAITAAPRVEENPNRFETGSAHVPVMVAEVLAFLDRRPGGIVIDATVGGGGHAREIMNVMPGDATYVGLDLDAAALARARRRLAPFGDRVKLVHASFRDIGAVAADFAGRVTNVLFDLGLSSDQLADTDRGFAFQGGALDMRFDDAGEGTTAAEVVNTFPEKELADLIYELGEEPRSRAIARAVVARRREWPFATAAELADVVARAVRRHGHGRIHPATRTFQALRIFVNDELGALAEALPRARALLAAGGRMITLAYHSLEDRIVKRFFREEASAGNLEILTPKVVRPSAAEVRANPRSRSARLRAARGL